MSKCANCGRQYLDHRAKDHACPIGAKTRIGYIHYRHDMVYTEKIPEKGTKAPKKGTKKPPPRGKKGTYINIHYATDERIAICTPYGSPEWDNTRDRSEVTCRSCIRCMNKRTQMDCCPVCGGKLIGDGYTTVVHCENVDMPFDIEPDANPVFCEEENGTDTR